MSDIPLYSVISSGDCISRIINECKLQRADIGHCRASSKCLLHSIDSTLERLDARQPNVGDLCGLLTKLRGLRHLTADGLFDDVKSYGGLSTVHAQLQQELSAHTRLTSLAISSSDLKYLGALKWAHQVAAQAAHSTPHATSSSHASGGSSPTSSSSSGAQSEVYQGTYESLAYDSQHATYWLPDWLAAPPALNTVIISPPASSYSNSTGFCSLRPDVPVCLWLSPSAWCDKLTTLEIHSLPLQDCLPPAVAKLTRLQQLSLVGCALQPRAAVQLVHQVGCSCKQLQVLRVSHGDLWQLPRNGWEGLVGVSLKELDLSHNQLVTLPNGLAHLTQLTSLQLQHNQLTSLPMALAAVSTLRLLDVSHNWLSGLNTPAGLLPALLAGWPCLQVLRLQNVSDKRGSLVLPSKLAACQQLTELALGHNFDLDMDSLVVLMHCKALKSVDLSHSLRSAAAPTAEQLLARLRSKSVCVVSHSVRMCNASPS